MTLRNALEKRSALEKEISTLTSTNSQLDQEISELHGNVEPLKAKREELVQ